MGTQSLASCYDGVLALMDLTEQAIERKDLDAVCSLNEHLALLIVQIEGLGAAAVPHPSARQVASTIRRILERLEHNQNRIARWMAETGGRLGDLAKGATAVHGYAPQVHPGALFAVREA